MPKTGRLLIGMVAGFKSERWPVFDRNGGRLHLGIRTVVPLVPMLARLMPPGRMEILVVLVGIMLALRFC